MDTNTTEESPEKTNVKLLDELLDEAERLIWALLDQTADDADVKRLEKMVIENQQVRRRYLECAQIHADLYHHFTASPRLPVESPVLGSLGSLSPGIGSGPVSRP